MEFLKKMKTSLSAVSVACVGSPRLTAWANRPDPFDLSNQNYLSDYNYK